MSLIAESIGKIREAVYSNIINPSGAMSGSKYAGSAIDLHSYIAAGIRQLPAKYQPGVEWYKWIPGKSPLSTTPHVALAVVLYLSTLFIGRELMKGRKPYKFATLFQIHNLLLSSASGLLLVLMLIEIVPIIFKHGFFYAICDKRSWTPRLETYYIINYLFKYWELADTLFLVVKKKPLAFLHVYHHSATAVLCYTQLHGGTSISWTVITLNLLVHVIMYYYYWATAAGYKIWWKRYVTVMQITQFILDLGLVYFGTLNHFAYKHNKPCVGDCAGSEFAALQGCAILSSYLVLFISFYRKTYKKAATKTELKNAISANGKTSAEVKAKANGKPINGNAVQNRQRSQSIANAALAADSLFDETCGPAGVNKPDSRNGSGFNTPVSKM
ncbi:ELO-domain-containing protein [Cystobasidium minutum MCA 4210]|uniref:ELO-domain-containing protein n=1 Tax=Cystobasidium minutum MCA 4210 TaxID=1397322 RepID=UPI0034CDAF74|eukprot:jgi/Rhomi1/11888/CE11887_577